MRYDGYNGQVELTSDSLVITRTGLVAKAAYGTRTDPRTIPLQAITGVRFQDATRLKNGSVRLLLGSNRDPRPRREMANEPDTILFTHGQQNSFAELRRWLDAVVTKNAEYGVDSEKAAREAGVSQVLPEDMSQVASDARTGRHMDKYGSGGDRPDVAAAAARMRWKFGGRRELKKLPEYLHPGEVVQVIAQGKYRTDAGIVVLTTQRLLFLFQGLTKHVLVDFPLDRISSVSNKPGLVFGELVVHAAGTTRPSRKWSRRTRRL
jgi:hypothetical protein